MATIIFTGGGAGNDGLFGGPGIDNLYGGSGADRFLVEPYDIFVGPTSEDAVIFFRTGNKSWTPAEIEQVDQALAILHHATENTTLLKCSSGAVMTFERANGFGAGTNSGGHIVLTDLVMNGSSTWEIGYYGEQKVLDTLHGSDPKESVPWSGVSLLPHAR